MNFWFQLVAEYFFFILLDNCQTLSDTSLNSLCIIRSFGSIVITRIVELINWAYLPLKHFNQWFTYETSIYD